MASADPYGIMKAYFAGAEETKNQDPIEYWSITIQSTSQETEWLEFTYGRRMYKIQKPENIKNGDILMLRAPSNLMVREIPKNHITEISSI